MLAASIHRTIASFAHGGSGTVRVRPRIPITLSNTHRPSCRCKSSTFKRTTSLLRSPHPTMRPRIARSRLPFCVFGSGAFISSSASSVVNQFPVPTPRRLTPRIRKNTGRVFHGHEALVGGSQHKLPNCGQPLINARRRVAPRDQKHDVSLDQRFCQRCFALCFQPSQKISKSLAIHGAGARVGDARNDEVAERGEGGARGGGRHRDYHAIIHIIAGKQKANQAKGVAREIIFMFRSVPFRLKPLSALGIRGRFGRD